MEFFEAFHDSDGSLRGSYHTYEGPSEFLELLEDHLRELIWDRIHVQPAPETLDETATEVEPAVLWEGNPYRGLSAFTESDAPIFFGRGRETDSLVSRLASPENRFLAVIGPSGSGKSSLVAAGLLPRLKAGAIPGSRDWIVARFTPTEVSHDPFTALATELAGILGFPGSQHKPRELVDRLHAEPTAIAEIAATLLDGQPQSAEVLLFVDQFEELFTLVGQAHRESFVALLESATRASRVRVVLTMRSDFYDQCTHYEPLVALLRQSTFVIGTPGVGALTNMIERPARTAGLTLEAELVQTIVDETGTEPGALPLMEFTLTRLYEACEGDALTVDAYKKIGGVAGAIEVQAEQAIPNDDRTVTWNPAWPSVISAIARGRARRRGSRLHG